MLQIADRDVVYTGQIVLTDEEENFRLKLDNGIILDIRFFLDATQQPSVSPYFSEGVFTVDLFNFGNPLGMSTSGIIRAQTATGYIREQNGVLRPGAWVPKYALAVHTIGDDKPTRLVNLTISDKRLA